jgi:glucose-fructose oxidoreductase
MDGEAPQEVTCVVDETPGIEVDQHSITVCRYARGLSKMETRWGTFTDPWTIQPQPEVRASCSWGRTARSRAGTTTPMSPCRRGRGPSRTPYRWTACRRGRRTPVEYVLGLLERGERPEGCLDPELCLTAQRIVDTAAQSAREKRTLELLP